MKPKFFLTTADFEGWLDAHSDCAAALEVGFYKSKSGHASITYAQALDAALCVGWIDGVRHSIDGTSYAIRFSPRKAGSIWSLVNIKRANELIAGGRMKASGTAAFASRDPAKSKRYSYENRSRSLDPGYAKTFRANRRAWNFFQSQAPFYRRVTTYWVMSAKREETRKRRLQILIESSACENRVGILERKPASSRRK